MIKRYWQWILQSIAVHCVSTSHLLCQNSPNGDLLRGGSMERLDQTDELILAELAEDARATYAEIGQRVNLSAPAVKRRVDRLLDHGFIRGVPTVVHRNALSWSTEAYVQVFCHGPIAPDELRAAWVDMPEVVSA